MLSGTSVVHMECHWSKSRSGLAGSSTKLEGKAVEKARPQAAGDQAEARRQGQHQAQVIRQRPAWLAACRVGLCAACSCYLCRPWCPCSNISPSALDPEVLHRQHCAEESLKPASLRSIKAMLMKSLLLLADHPQTIGIASRCWA